MMQTEYLLQHLEALFRKLAIPIQYEPFDEGTFRGLNPEGGMCRLRGKRLVVMNARLDPSERVGVLLRAAARLDLEGIYVPPAVRAEIRRHAASSDLRARPRYGRATLRLVVDRHRDERMNPE